MNRYLSALICIPLVAHDLWIGLPLAVHGDKLPEQADMEPAPAPNTHPALQP